MRILHSAVFTMFLLPFFAPVVHAEDVETDDGWRHRVDISFAMPALGYEPATVIYDDRMGTYDASSAPRRIFRFSGTLAAQGEYMAFDLRPYTDTRYANGGLQVAVGGLEARISTPFTHRFVLGFYHHSAHNFSDGAYGFGTNLNSMYGNARWFDASFDLLGSRMSLTTRAEAHVFLTRKGTPYVLTDTTVLLPDRDDATSWRLVNHVVIRGASIRSEPSVTLHGEGSWRLASGVIDVPFMVKTGACPFLSRVLGTLGERLFIGPYGTFGWNVYETERYGEIVWSAGIRMDVIVSDTTN